MSDDNNVPFATPKPTAISGESMDGALFINAVETGNLIKVSSRDLLPNAAQNPLFHQVKEDGDPYAVFVATGRGNDALDKPEARLVTPKEGTPFILINEGYHKLSEDYVRDHFMLHDSNISDMVQQKIVASSDNAFSTLSSALEKKEADAVKPRYDAIIDGIKQEAKDRGIHSLAIFIGQDYDDSHTGSKSTSTLEGNNYLFIKEDLLRNAIISGGDIQERLHIQTSRALAYIADGDTSPAGIIRRRDLAEMRQSNLKADLESVGPLGTRGAEAFAGYLKADLTKSIPRYLESHADSKISADAPKDADLKVISEWMEKTDSPVKISVWDRISAAEELAARMKDAHPTTLDERKAEDARIIPQVLNDMADKVKTLPSLAPKPDKHLEPDGNAELASLLNIRHQEQIAHIQATLGGKQDAVSMDSNPTSPKAVLAKAPGGSPPRLG